jgi:hypothetical protein
MRPPWKEMDEDRTDLILTGISKGSGSEMFRKEAAKNTKDKKKYIPMDPSRTMITPNRTYRRRVHLQSIVFRTEQEAIIKAIWLTDGTQRDKVIITDSLRTLTAINGNYHTKNPKTIKLREMMDRNKK